MARSSLRSTSLGNGLCEKGLLHGSKPQATHTCVHASASSRPECSPQAVAQLQQQLWCLQVRPEAHALLMRRPAVRLAMQPGLCGAHRRLQLGWKAVQMESRD